VNPGIINVTMEEFYKSEHLHDRQFFVSLEGRRETKAIPVRSKSLGCCARTRQGKEQENMRARHGISSATLYKGKSKHGGLKSVGTRLMALEDENCA